MALHLLDKFIPNIFLFVVIGQTSQNHHAMNHTMVKGNMTSESKRTEKITVSEKLVEM
jgi:hypothetical protein